MIRYFAMTFFKDETLNHYSYKIYPLKKKIPFLTSINIMSVFRKCVVCSSAVPINTIKTKLLGKLRSSSIYQWSKVQISLYFRGKVTGKETFSTRITDIYDRRKVFAYKRTCVCKAFSSPG